MAVSISLLWTLLFLGFYAYASMPVWFGQTVPAKIRYFADYSETIPRDPALWNNRITARLSYDWHGERRHEFLWVDTGLIETHPNRSIVPVKVLGNRSVVWPDGHSDAHWQRMVFSGWMLFRRMVLLWLGFCGLLAATIPLGQRLDAKRVREGAPRIGRILSYHDWLSRKIKGEVPEKGSVEVRYEYPGFADGSESAGRMIRATCRLHVRFARRLPPPDQPVTVLFLPGWWTLGVDSVLYPTSLYEAVPPQAGANPTLTSTPRPGTG